MPVNSTHPNYQTMSARWVRCRDAYEGEDNVKTRGETYLPRLSSHTSATDPKYVAYKSRAMFYGATGRTVEGLCGMATRKPYTIDAPEVVMNFENDITGTGITLRDFIKTVARDVLVTGRFGILVDRTEDGSRPYFAGYAAENILNWRFDSSGKLALLVVKEVRDEIDPADKYVVARVSYYREFMLDELGFVVAKVWREEKGATGVTQFKQVGGDILPTFRGQRIAEIPFVFVNSEGSGADIVKPPLLDMVNVNFSHYRNSADLEHGRHFVALPTPWFTGVSAGNLEDGSGNNAQITIGSETAILLPDPQSSAGMLEFTGQGLSALENALKSKEDLMAILGARLLENTKRAAETAETTRLNKSGDNSMLASIVNSVSDAIARALRLMAQWEGNDPEAVMFEMPRDMLDTTLDATQISALVQAMQAGGISLDTFLYNMKLGEILPDDVDVEDEKSRIENAKPKSTGTPMNLDDDPDAGQLDEDGKPIKKPDDKTATK